MVSVEQLTVEFGGFTLFGDLSFVVNQSDKIALVGRNGAGKSTLLKIFAGIQHDEYGNRKSKSTPWLRQRRRFEEFGRRKAIYPNYRL